jgi:hypothetical protein
MLKDDAMMACVALELLHATWQIVLILVAWPGMAIMKQIEKI